MSIRIIIHVYVLLAFHLTITTYVVAQTTLPRNYIPPSPIAANLGLYATIPVNYYTGVPDISIPISNVKIKNADIAINLSYHSNAVRKADEASWVGLGWSLNAGGVITRTKRQKDDFSAHGFYKYTATNRPCNDDYDQEPDLFFFNFAGRTGKFFIESTVNGQPVIRSMVKDMLRIRISITGGWEITDENGTVYQFEAKEYIKEDYTTPKKTETETFVSSWYLTRITNVFNESISFYYTTTGNKIYKKTSYASYKMLSGFTPYYLFNINVMFGDKNGIQEYAELAGTKVTELSTSETYTDEVVLNRISFPDGSIECETGDRQDLYLQNRLAYGKKLDKIIIRRVVAGGEAVFKSFTLNYSYFYAAGALPAYMSARLQLTRVSETAGAFTLPAYQLFYNQNNIPNKENTTNFGGFLNDVSAGLLNKIVYPTGGFSTFLYEPNIQNVGARIKRIEHKDPDAGVGIRVYDYAGGKQLTNSFPINGTDQTSAISGIMSDGAGTLTVNGTLVYKNYMSSDQCMMGESSGDYLIGYDKVTEYLGEGGQYGKCEYTFTNIASPATYGVPAEISGLNGSLTTKEEFANRNGTFITAKKTTREVVTELLSTTSVKRRFQNACNNNYSLRTDWIKLLSETAYTYDNSTHPVILSKSYRYENAAHIFPTTIENTDSKENTWQTTYKYPIEKAKEEGGVYTKMVFRNMVSPVIEETRSKAGSVLSVSRTSYKEWNYNVLAPETEEFKKGNSAPETRVRFYNYDEKGNPLEVSKEDDVHTAYVWDYNSTYPVAQITNATSGNAAYTSFETEDPKNNASIQSKGITSADAFTGNHSFNLSYPSFFPEQGISFYMSGTNHTSVVSFWAKNGTPVLTYGYTTTMAVGSAYRHGAPVNGWSYYEVELNDIGSLYITGTGLIDELRIYPKDAQMNTYTYSPMVGMTEECDRNNQVIRYQYDTFGRLQFVKDRENNIVKSFEYHFKY